MKGKLLIIGFGPGSFQHITERAREAIQESDIIIGYKTYVELIEGLLTTQEIISTGLTDEEMVRLIETNGIQAIVDASHPFAEEASKNAMNAAKTAGVPSYSSCH
jgi:precorrin-3B methylase